jgi:hypothetical protein
MAYSSKIEQRHRTAGSAVVIGRHNDTSPRISEEAGSDMNLIAEYGWVFVWAFSAASVVWAAVR